MSWNVASLNHLDSTVSPLQGSERGESGVATTKQMDLCLSQARWLKQNKRSQPNFDKEPSIKRVKGCYGNCAIRVKALINIASLRIEPLPQLNKYAIFNHNQLWHLPCKQRQQERLRSCADFPLPYSKLTGKFRQIRIALTTFSITCRWNGLIEPALARGG